MLNGGDGVVQVGRERREAEEGLNVCCARLEEVLGGRGDGDGRGLEEPC